MAGKLSKIDRKYSEAIDDKGALDGDMVNHDPCDFMDFVLLCTESEKSLTILIDPFSLPKLNDFVDDFAGTRNCKLILSLKESGLCKQKDPFALSSNLQK